MKKISIYVFTHVSNICILVMKRKVRNILTIAYVLKCEQICGGPIARRKYYFTISHRSNENLYENTANRLAVVFYNFWHINCP